ncbi:dihydrofolate reductase family protein [Microbacterium sp. 179-I 3D3 NHS]|uniref:dihydrofolate reductase family protein n=1 Tax=unclassified Microbacterium TaxID=2609290 RepID=UPI0039A016DA
MSRVFVHATVSLDGFMADEQGEIGWMEDCPSVPEDEALIAGVVADVGAVVGGANKTQTIEDGEIPYGGLPDVPVFLMTHHPRGPIEKNGVTYEFLDDIDAAVAAAKTAAGDRWVSLLGGSIARQCLERGLVDEIRLHVVPIVLGRGISLFSGLSQPVELERVDTAAYDSAVHLRYRVVSVAT